MHRESAIRPAAALLLAAVAVLVYLPNLDNYFLADDFDLIHTVHEKPASYFAKLLFSDESGQIWNDPQGGQGYLRPVKIWLLKMDLLLWGNAAWGYHLTSTLLFAGIVLAVTWIVQLLGGSRLGAFAAGIVTSVHPVFSETVPFITAREELLTALFALLAVGAFLRHRLDGARALWFHVFFGFSLFAKEYGLATILLPVGFDLIDRWIVGSGRAGIRTLTRFYGPALAIVAVYFVLRLIAFGNFAGGGGEGVTDFSLLAILTFHVRFFESQFNPTMFTPGGISSIGLALAPLALIVAVWVMVKQRDDADARRSLLFAGPVWYAASTSIVAGAYFSIRHNIMPTVGLIVFGALVIEGLLRGLEVRKTWPVVLAALPLLVACLYPPTLETALEHRQASRIVRELRERIVEQAAGLPDGCVIKIEGAPQWGIAPWYFGWGILNALRRPFTESDLANRCEVIDLVHYAMIEQPVEVPARYDAVIRFDERHWITPVSLRKRVARVQRDER